MPRPAIDLIGACFGNLRVIGRADNDKNGQARWVCLCSCGNTTTVLSAHLRYGETNSCGHLRVTVNREMRTRHGACKDNKWTTEYTIWRGMKKRCLNPRNAAYWRYGGRGITICERWRIFENFLADMGSRPGRGYSIDRVDNNGNYEPGNCRWATHKQQHRNTSRNVFVTLDGRSVTLAEASEILQVDPSNLSSKLKSYPSRKSIDARLWGTRGPSKIK